MLKVQLKYPFDFMDAYLTNDANAKFLGLFQIKTYV